MSAWNCVNPGVTADFGATIRNTRIAKFIQQKANNIFLLFDKFNILVFFIYCAPRGL